MDDRQLVDLSLMEAIDTLSRVALAPVPKRRSENVIYVGDILDTLPWDTSPWRGKGGCWRVTRVYPTVRCEPV